MTETTSDGRKNLKTRTKLVYAGRHPFEQHGFVNTPVYRGSTVLFPTYQDLVTRNAKFHLWHAGHADDGSADERLDRDLRRRRHRARALRPCRDHARAAHRGQGRRSHPRHRFRSIARRASSATAFWTRMGVETTYYDPLVGAGIEALIRPNTSVVFLETPGSQSFELQDVPAIAEVARARASAPSSTIPGRRRCFSRRMSAASTWRSRPARNISPAIPICCSGLVSANARMVHAPPRDLRRFRHVPRPRGCVSGAARLAHAGPAAARGGAAGARSCRFGSPAATEVVHVLHPALPSCPGHALVEARFSRLFGAFFGPSRALPAKGARRHARRAETVRHGLFLGRLREPRHPLRLPRLSHGDRTGGRQVPALRFNVGLEDIDDLKADLERGFERLREASQ